jgi:hypothetical protein
MVGPLYVPHCPFTWIRCLLLRGQVPPTTVNGRDTARGLAGNGRFGSGVPGDELPPSDGRETDKVVVADGRSSIEVSTL